MVSARRLNTNGALHDGQLKECVIISVYLVLLWQEKSCAVF